MKSNELRIGNWVNYNGHPIKVRGTTDKGIWLKDIVFPDNSVTGIRLTPEILLKAGAGQAIGSEWAYVLNISAISIKFRFNGIDCYSELGGIYLGDKIEYLHQLQNLYNSLTHHELTIEL